MKSMTGYGSAEGKVGDGLVFAEVRSVNSRFLDINCKTPPSMFPVELKIKKSIQNKIIRGKVEVFLKEKKGVGGGLQLSVNKNLVKQYKNCLNQITGMLGIKASSHLLEVMDLKDLVAFHERVVDVVPLWPQINRVILKALAKVERMRVIEGRTLKNDQMMRLKKLKYLVSSIEKRSAVMFKSLRENGSGKASAEGGSASGGCFATTFSSEQAQMDRIDVTEELIRLGSHIKQYRSIASQKGAVGRQLDFLIQEMHREINTIGSKACDGAMSNLVVEVKSEVEKLREQVQNVE